MNPPKPSLSVVEAPPPKPGAKALLALEAYKALGPGRSLAKLAVDLRETHGKAAPSLRTLEDWSSKFDWQTAIAAYEKQRAEERRRKREDEIDRMNDAHVVIAQASITRAMKHIEKLIAANDMPAKDAIAYLKLALDTERLARGASTEAATVHMQLTGKEGEPPVSTQNMNIGFYAVQLPQKDEQPS